jgi:hypothetical protein
MITSPDLPPPHSATTQRLRAHYKWQASSSYAIPDRLNISENPLPTSGVDHGNMQEICRLE